MTHIQQSTRLITGHHRNTTINARETTQMRMHAAAAVVAAATRRRKIVTEVSAQHAVHTHATRMHPGALYCGQQRAGVPCRFLPSEKDQHAGEAETEEHENKPRNIIIAVDDSEVEPRCHARTKLCCA